MNRDPRRSARRSLPCHPRRRIQRAPQLSDIPWSEAIDPDFDSVDVEDVLRDISADRRREGGGSEC